MGPIRRMLGLLLAAAASAGTLSCAPRAGHGAAAQGPAAPAAYHSPEPVAFSGDGRLLAVGDVTARQVAIIEVATRRIVRRTPLRGAPVGLAWGGRKHTLYASEHGAAAVAEIDAETGRILRRLAVGRYPYGLAVSARRRVLLVCQEGLEELAVVDLDRGTIARRVVLPGSPRCVAATPDGESAVVAVFTPTTDATTMEQAACVSVIDLGGAGRAADVTLSGGSTCVRGLAVSPDGQWAFVAHARGDAMLSTTHLDYGWVNRNMLSVIDLKARRLYAPLVLDRGDRGAADPWGVAVSGDGRRVFVALSGAGELAELNWHDLLPLLEGKATGERITREPVWQVIAADPNQRELMFNDFSALTEGGLLRRLRLAGAAPRGVAFRGAPARRDGSPSSDGGPLLAVANYFAGEVLLAKADELAPAARAGGADEASAYAIAASSPSLAASSLVGRIALGPQPPETPARRGERLFHDGAFAYQCWLSCATCHPDGRVDGINWDLLNDGMGNPKNTRSLVLADRTPPMMALGVRGDLPSAVRAGFEHILFADPNAADLADTEAYIRSLAPAVSPFRDRGGELTGDARRGRKLFGDPRTGCWRCHPAPLYADLHSHDVGTASAQDANSAFDTPALIELWRTAPYLHDGSAPTLRDVLTTRNAEDRHGQTSRLTSQQIDDLVAFLLSL